MINILIKLPVLLLVMLFANKSRVIKNSCDAITVSPRGQQLLIKHPHCTWVRIEYSTTNWKCKMNNCEQTGGVTWHDVKIDTRNKENIFYYLAALGPASVSKVEEANVLDCNCQ
jgi:hypothetical protein